MPGIFIGIIPEVSYNPFAFWNDPNEEDFYHLIYHTFFFCTMRLPEGGGWCGGNYYAHRNCNHLPDKHNSAIPDKHTNRKPPTGTICNGITGTNTNGNTCPNRNLMPAADGKR